MTERATIVDDTAVNVGLLLESARAHQKLAESQIEKLHAHTQDLDGVVRDEIRRTLVEELHQLTVETARAARELKKIQARAAAGSMLRGLATALLCTLIPIGIARWAMPSPEDLERLRSRRSELTANLQKLEQQGARIDWRHCGDTRRLCVRIDRGAPIYGEKADYFVVRGY